MHAARMTQIKSEYSIGSAIGSVIIWAILTVITLGIGLFFFAYYFQKDVINKSYVVDSAGRKIGRLYCTIGLGDVIGHAFLWMLLTIITLGLAVFVYQYRVSRYVYNHTEIEWFD